jgi:pimeloyl-ACP methyl ester carboxylesterase
MNTSENPASEPGAPNALPIPRPARSGHVVSRDGTRIAYDRVGSGPPVIVIVGALCSRTLGPGVKLAPMLAAGFTVFTYDRRGRGDSGNGPGGSDGSDNGQHAIAREIEDLEALIIEAGGWACVFGHSSGAVLALRAAEHGLPIKKLALYEAPFIVDKTRSPLEQEWRQIDAFLKSGRPGDAVKVFMKSVGVPAFAIAVMRWLPVWKTVTKVAHTLPYDGALVHEFQRGEPLPTGSWSRVTVPALAIDGGKSPRWMRNGTRALAKVLSNAQHRTLEGQTHDVSAKALAPVIVDFFASHAA